MIEMGKSTLAYSLRGESAILLKSMGLRFWALCDKIQRTPLYIIDLNTGNIFPYIRDAKEFDEFRIESGVVTGVQGNHFSGWTIPDVAILKNTLSDKEFPLTGARKLKRFFGKYTFLSTSGSFDLDDSILKDSIDPFIMASGFQSIFSALGEERFSSVNIYPVCLDISGKPVSEVLDAIFENNLVLMNPSNEFVVIDSWRWLMVEKARLYDFLVAGLPEVQSSEVEDPAKGLWEAWSGSSDASLFPPARPRNPAKDARKEYIAIDFGTSSTVVARETENGTAELVLVCADAYYGDFSPQHFENPTVIQSNDSKGMLAAWNSVAYRPPVMRDQVKVSHEALCDLRQNKTSLRILGATVRYLKRWALSDIGEDEIVVIDRKENGAELRIPSVAPRMPVKGVKIDVSEGDPLDPVELYAFFLGLYVNYRQRGLYTNYLMTFPVKYPKLARQRILASFWRGIQRSFPESFIHTKPFSRFSVSEIASEPAAYAVSALERLDITPDDSGVHYAVFDFGGGTSDFDYGLYRLPNDQEREEDWELVFEHFRSAGDRYLGGENILEGMAYLVFSHNQNVCREKSVCFSLPRGFHAGPEIEVLIDGGQRAQVNTLVMMEYLRQYWEGISALEGTEPVTLDLTDRKGIRISCQFSIPFDDLRAYIRRRIEEGVAAFIYGMKEAFKDRKVCEVVVLLGGNSSKSEYLLDCFRWKSDVALDDIDADVVLTSSESEYCDFSLGASTVRARRDGSFAARMLNEHFGDDSEVRLIVYPPLLVDESDPYAPTAKTGVALGLLKLYDGSAIKIINHYSEESEVHASEAPFPFYVGKCFERYFQPAIQSGDRYNDWKKVGIIRGESYDLWYTQFPKAATGRLPKGSPRLLLCRLDVPSEAKGNHIMIRPVSHNEIEVGYVSRQDESAEPEVIDRVVLK